jgi:outer membrane protein assembly factor BamB
MRGQAPAGVDPKKGRAYLGFSDGTVTAVSLAKGEDIWSATLTKPTTPFADVDAQPIVVDKGKAVIVASYAGGIAKLDADSGRVMWKREVFRIDGMTRAGPDLVVGTSGDGQAVGIGADNGTVRWRYKFKKGSPTEPIWLGKGMVLVGCSRSAAAVLRVADGKPVQLIWPGSGSSAAPAWRDPDVAFLSNKGMIFTLRYGGGEGITVGEPFLHGH